MQDLGTLGGDTSVATGINDSGQVAGYSYTANDATEHAFLYSNGTMQDLGTLGGSGSIAYGINTSGQVVGQSALAGNTMAHAFLYTAGAGMQDLGTLGGSVSHAEGINASGQVVGTSDTAAGYGDAFLYSGGVMLNLNNLISPSSGWFLADADAINDIGSMSAKEQIQAAKPTPTY